MLMINSSEIEFFQWRDKGCWWWRTYTIVNYRTEYRNVRHIFLTVSPLLAGYMHVFLSANQVPPSSSHCFPYWIWMKLKGLSNKNHKKILRIDRLLALLLSWYVCKVFHWFSYLFSTSKIFKTLCALSLLACVRDPLSSQKGGRVKCCLLWGSEECLE